MGSGCLAPRSRSCGSSYTAPARAGLRLPATTSRHADGPGAHDTRGHLPWVSREARRGVDLGDDVAPEREQVAVGERERSGLAVMATAGPGDDDHVVGLERPVDRQFRAVLERRALDLVELREPVSWCARRGCARRRPRSGRPGSPCGHSAGARPCTGGRSLRAASWGILRHLAGRGRVPLRTLARSAREAPAIGYSDRTRPAGPMERLRSAGHMANPAAARFGSLYLSPKWTGSKVQPWVLRCRERPLDHQAAGANGTASRRWPIAVRPGGCTERPRWWCPRAPRVCEDARASPSR